MLTKYPRTQHIEGSRLQPGDEDLQQVPLAALAGRHLVIEEKMDGANAGVSFDEDGTLRLQSRGHYLGGGPRERHFALFKQWAHAHEIALYEVLGSRYLMYGEWLYAKHTVFYDALPHYFMEFDVLDRETGAFVSTDRRRALLEGAPVVSVLVLRAEVVLMSGLPGAGKSRYAAERLGDRPQISLDGLRRELDVDPEDGQGRVVEAARTRAREALRRGEPFVWNATSLSRQLRRQCIDLFASYRARVRIVYVEASCERLWRQNAERQGRVPQAAIERLLERWEVPDRTEAHIVDWVD